MLTGPGWSVTGKALKCPISRLVTRHGSGRDQVLASPAVRARAKDLGIDLTEVKAAADGRLRHADLDAFLSYSNGGHAPAGRRRADEQVKVIGMRRRIPENMAASKRNIPHFSYVEEIDVSDLETLREQLNANRGSKPKLTLLPLIITAICKALPDFPMINARYDDEAGVVTRSGAVHLGMATQTEAGLMVPVIRDAQAANLWQLATEIQELISPSDHIVIVTTLPENLADNLHPFMCCTANCEAQEGGSARKNAQVWICFPLTGSRYESKTGLPCLTCSRKHVWQATSLVVQRKA